jgi:sodium-independent sulfate anion transporter 11
MAANGNVEVSPQVPFIYETKLVTTNEWIHEHITNDITGRIKRYLISIFPIFSWIYRYNLTWLVGGIHHVSY